MGLYDSVTARGAAFVCSEGHDLSDCDFQSKDFGCTMGNVFIDGESISMDPGGWGHPEHDPFNADIEIYCDCTRCPAFVQWGTGNLVPCGVVFLVKTDGAKVTSVERTSIPTSEWLAWQPAQHYMARCEGPMPYDEARNLHVYYDQRRPEAREAFWAERSKKA